MIKFLRDQKFLRLLSIVLKEVEQLKGYIKEELRDFKHACRDQNTKLLRWLSTWRLSRFVYKLMLVYLYTLSVSLDTKSETVRS